MASFSIPGSVSPILCIMLALLLIPSSEGKDYLVGGRQDSWTLPRPSPDSLNQWAQKQRFKIGDSLLWKYDHRSESVLQVKEEDYKNCNISKPITKYDDGDTKVKLDRSGPFYFISGADGHCQQGLRLAVVVISQRHKGTHDPPSPLPSPSPAPAPSPKVAAPQPEKGGAAGLVRGGLVGVATGLGVSLVVMMMMMRAAI